MSWTIQAKILLTEIEVHTVRDNIPEVFTEFFNRGCDLLGGDIKELADRFDTSHPNIERWKKGTVVPPAASLVLKFLVEELNKKLKEIN